MYSLWLTGGSAVLCACSCLLAASASAQQLNFPYLVFPVRISDRLQNRHTRITATIQRNGEEADNSGTLVRAKLREIFHRRQSEEKSTLHNCPLRRQGAVLVYWQKFALQALFSQTRRGHFQDLQFKSDLADFSHFIINVKN